MSISLVPTAQPLIDPRARASALRRSGAALLGLSYAIGGDIGPLVA
jgi:hypothetical protein